MHLHGRVVPGLGIGAKLGYPTANLECADGKCPAPGVYAARAAVDGVQKNAVAVVGARQVRGRPLVEVHVLDFHGNLRGRELEVEVRKKLSEIERCDSASALLKKIEDDVRKAREYFA